MIRISRVLTDTERRNMEDEAIARGWYRNDRRMFTPGMAWFEPWYFDPNGRPGMCAFGSSMLSMHYWRDWSTKRCPVVVVCPNGEQWEIDRKSRNGSGWVVTGELPDITCSPSIVVEGYHGFLRAGAFSADIEGRPPNGIVRPIIERAALAHL